MFRRVLPHQNRQPSQVPSVDSITTPGRIGLKKYTTKIKAKGEVSIMSAVLPGARKHVVALLGAVTITGDNLSKDVCLKKPNDWALLEFDGYQWQTLYRSKS